MEVRVQEGVVWGVPDPRLAGVVSLVAEEADHFEEVRAVWITSWRRPGDPNLHGHGLAVDLDFEWQPGVGRARQVEILEAVAARVQMRAGADLGVFAHASPAWHIHAELDPRVGPKRQADAGFYVRVRATQGTA